MTAPVGEADESAPTESPFDRKSRELEAVLRNMRIWKSDGQEALCGVSYDSLIPGIVRKLVLASQRGMAPKPDAKSAKKFAALVHGAKDLLTDPGYVGLLPLEIRLSLVQIAYSDASTVSTGRTGAPPKRQAADVAEVFGRHFYGLTAEHPSGFDDGVFQSHLAEIFKVLGIKAAAISQAKQATARLKETKPNLTEFLSG